MEKPGKRRPWKSLRDSHFPTATAATHLSLDDRDHFLQNPPASVASLRRLITSLRNADHDQLGIPITFTGIPNESEILLNELIQDGLLSPVGGNYTFYHHSFQEYFAAHDLNDPSGKKQSRVLRWFLKGNDWWREVLAFYVGMATNPSDLKSWIATHVHRVASLTAVDVAERQKYLYSTIDEYYPPTATALLEQHVG